MVSPPSELDDVLSKFYPEAVNDGQLTDLENEKTGDIADESLIQIHQALVHWAVTQWRPYFAYLAEDVDKYVCITEPLAGFPYH